MRKKYKLFILSIILTIISFSYIVLFSRSYTYTKKLDNITNIEDLNIKINQDKEIIAITNKEIKNGVLTLKFKSVSAGKAFIDIHNENEETIDMLKIYSHNFSHHSPDGDIVYQYRIPFLHFLHLPTGLVGL